MALIDRGRSRNREAIVWLELYGGPGDGMKRKRTRLPVTLTYPADFSMPNENYGIKPVLYKRWERVMTLVEDQLGRPRIVTAYLYVLDGLTNPFHRRKTYAHLQRKAK